MVPDVTALFDQRTFTITYIVADPASRRAAVIDSVLDYDPAGGRTWTESADAVIECVTAQGLTVDWILETHLHADHLTAAPYLKDKLGGEVAIGARIAEVQQTFAEIFHPEPGFAADGSQFDRLLGDGDGLDLGGLSLDVLLSPGHTPACAVYRIGDAAFCGDTIFMPDFGTARCDFPGGSARQLYRSIRRILDLAPQTRIFVGHDYGPGGRDYAWETTVADQRATNKHVRDGIDEDTFVAMREARDAELKLPHLILPAVQVNMRAGHLPPPDGQGIAYLKIPLNAL